MNKQKIIEAIEANKDRWKYHTKSYHDVDGKGVCTLGLLIETGNNIGNFAVFLSTEYGIDEEERIWIADQNDLHCDSFDCMITAIKGYESR
jgi:hypothetical protein